VTYLGYSAKVTFDADAEVLHGEVVGLRDVITFQATSVEGLKAAFRDSVDDYLKWCAELGQEPERAYAGRFLVRMDPGVHRDLALAAERAGISINAFVVACVEREVGRSDAGGAQGPNSAAGTTAMPSRRR
jgi:predicted HicB family RNase H-like nuclease